MNLSKKLKVIYKNFYKDIGYRKRSWKWENTLKLIIEILDATYLKVDGVNRENKILSIKIETKELGNLVIVTTINRYLISYSTGITDNLMWKPHILDKTALEDVKKTLLKTRENNTGL